MSQMNDREVLDAILYTLKANHAEMVAFKDETYNQFKSINEQFNQMNGRLDKMDQRFNKVDDRFDKVIAN